MHAESQKSSPYDPDFYHKTAPKLRASFLLLTQRAAPKQLRRQMHVGYFVLLLRDYLTYSLGDPFVARDPFSGGETYSSWTIERDDLVDLWAKITKRRIQTERHRRKKALAYLKAIAEMGLIDLVLVRDEETLYEIQFNPAIEWMQHKQWRLYADETFDDDDMTKLNKLHRFGNVCSWDWLLPNRRRLKVNEGGRLDFTTTKGTAKSVPVCARTWATYTRRDAEQQVCAILNGGCDNHPTSPYPAELRSLAKFTSPFKNNPKAKWMMREGSKVFVQKDMLDVYAPKFESWPCAMATLAKLFGHSVSTMKRHLAQRDVVNVIAQCKVLGKCDGRGAHRIAKTRAEAGAQPARFVPVPGDKGTYEVQLDLPNRIELKKTYQNWALYHDGTGGLDCRTKPVREQVPIDAAILYRPRVTLHMGRRIDERSGTPLGGVCKMGYIKLRHVGDEGLPGLDEQMKADGLWTWNGPWRKQKRVATRGDHRKSWSGFRQKGLVGSRTPFAALGPGPFEDQRRVNPRTHDRRTKRIDNEPHRRPRNSYTSLYDST